MKRAVIIITMLLSASVAFAATGASFLKIGTSARAAGLGNAYSAIADGAYSINYNPSGLALMNQSAIAAQHTEWIEGMNHEFFAVTVPLTFDADNAGTFDKGDFSRIGDGAGLGVFGAGVLGFGVVYLSEGTLEGRDDTGARTQDFTAEDRMINVSYANRLGKGWSSGIGVKFISQRIESETATGVAFDMGLMKQLGTSPVNLGLSIQNLGPKMKFISEGYDLPLTATVGAGYTIGGLIFAVDLKRAINENKSEICVGTEYMLMPMLTLRAGYLFALKSDIAPTSTDRLAGAGAGVGFKLFGTRTDYAFTPYGELGNTHRISFSMNFR
ncbi:MAG: PorV/PorQ family protein [Endomicrobiales bacterium]|nr:PorV/PorQ family protein [Endomicrobiales bacterium]